MVQPALLVCLDTLFHRIILSVLVNALEGNIGILNWEPAKTVWRIAVNARAPPLALVARLDID